MNTEFRDEINKYREYLRLQLSYKRQLQKIQQDQRRAEWEARKKEAENPIDADLPSDDPLVGHPWADEILQCKDLEKVLASFLPKEAKAADAKEEEKEKTWLKGAAGKMAGKDEVDPFADLAVSKKSKGAKKPAAPTAARIVLSMDTISSLSAIGVPIPTTAVDVQGCIDKVAPQTPPSLHTSLTQIRLFPLPACAPLIDTPLPACSPAGGEAQGVHGDDGGAEEGGQGQGGGQQGGGAARRRGRPGLRRARGREPVVHRAGQGGGLARLPGAVGPGMRGIGGGVLGPGAAGRPALPAARAWTSGPAPAPAH